MENYRDMQEGRYQSTTNKDSMIHLGRILKELRQGLGLSLRKAAGLAAISPAHLCKIEQGDIFQSLGITILIKLAVNYRVSLTSILREAGFIEDTDDYLPPFTQYLRMKFHLPAQAIRDIEISKAVVEEKYTHLLTNRETGYRSSKEPTQEKLRFKNIR